ncbi:MAG TPA: hypothetical protein DD405_03635 [Desulfobacteraceae bacterium]|nr:hypothetical protein [Desulfobacteraceae bacterium]
MDKASVEHLLPKEIALKAENIGVIKANMNPLSTLFLSILAGVFISLGAAFYTAIIANNGINIPMDFPFGIIKFAGGIAFKFIDSDIATKKNIAGIIDQMNNRA